ncbi:fibroblast growth factor 1 isoform X2 [Sciurus carolinensis]|uniref:fibroblast growth factor 1 isoform X2 n=1 Tax=Sciurus carolinensis TaxID=30640 RepID=UPI001FB23ABF|nr:fibroblast growth factor 1 isoform X2 [Sciurus carolinensis]
MKTRGLVGKIRGFQFPSSEFKEFHLPQAAGRSPESTAKTPKNGRSIPGPLLIFSGSAGAVYHSGDESVQLQLSAESVGEVYIKSTETGQYLAMDTDGLLYGSTPNEECLFLERLEENHYNTYTSKKHAEKNWFVGLKKNGSCKRGPRTHYGQKAILFLPLPVSSD